MPGILIIISDYMLVSFAEAFGTTGASLLNLKTLLPFAWIFGLFLYLMRS